MSEDPLCSTFHHLHVLGQPWGNRIPSTDLCVLQPSQMKATNWKIGSLQIHRKWHFTLTLEDVFVELDGERAQRLVSCLGRHIAGFQAIVWSSTLVNFDPQYFIYICVCVIGPWRRPIHSEWAESSVKSQSHKHKCISGETSPSAHVQSEFNFGELWPLWLIFNTYVCVVISQTFLKSLSIKLKASHLAC